MDEEGMAGVDLKPCRPSSPEWRRLRAYGKPTHNEKYSGKTTHNEKYSECSEYPLYCATETSKSKRTPLFVTFLLTCNYWVIPFSVDGATLKDSTKWTSDSAVDLRSWLGWKSHTESLEERTSIKRHTHTVCTMYLWNQWNSLLLVFFCVKISVSRNSYQQCVKILIHFMHR